METFLWSTTTSHHFPPLPTTSHHFPPLPTTSHHFPPLPTTTTTTTTNNNNNNENATHNDEHGTISLGLGRSAQANMEHIWMSLSQPPTRNLALFLHPCQSLDTNQMAAGCPSVMAGSWSMQAEQTRITRTSRWNLGDFTTAPSLWAPSLRQRAPSWQVCTRVSELVCRLQDHTKSLRIKEILMLKFENQKWESWKTLLNSVKPLNFRAKESPNVNRHLQEVLDRLNRHFCFCLEHGNDSRDITRPQTPRAACLLVSRSQASHATQASLLSLLGFFSTCHSANVNERNQHSKGPWWIESTHC